MTALVDIFTGLIGIRKDGEKFVFSVIDLVQTLIAMGIGALTVFILLKFTFKKF